MKVSNEGKINYNNIVQPNAVFGIPIGRNQYKFDEEGNIKSYPDGLINAIDINWGGAEVKDSQINTTDDLLDLINGLGSGGSSDTPIDSNQIIPIMLSAIRALQAEVVKLRNSFVDGVYSCTGKQTKMSATNYSLSDVDAEEPLWAIDETTLSEILSVDLSSSNDFDHNDNIEINVENNSLTFNELTYWEDTDSSIENVILGNKLPTIAAQDSELQPMPKTYIYLKSTGLDITFYLKNVTDDNDILEIPLNRLVDSNDQDLYNILCVIATSIKEEKNNVISYYGKNFCWIQVGHYIYDGIQQGYYNKSTNALQKDEITFGDKRYVIYKIGFNNLTLSKLAFYTKYQNFSNEVESINPDYDTRYKTAHITIRSIDTYDNLDEIKDQLPENELIYVEKSNTLYIKNEYKLKKIGSGGTTPDGEQTNPEDIETMTNKELLEALKKMGIVYEHYTEDHDAHDYVLELAALDSVTFINQETGKKFDISVDAYGKLKSLEQTDENLASQLDEILTGKKMALQSDAYEGPNNAGIGFDIRGFNGRLNYALNNIKKDENGEAISTYNDEATNDMKLNSDRIRIGSVYCPLKSDKVFGCSHGFIELENSGDKDFYLDGCAIYYTDQTKIYSLPLTGKVPAGGTYLIRCKKFADHKTSPNVYINIDSYDIEWWITNEENKRELLDTSIAANIVTSFALVHLDDAMPELTIDTKLFLTVTDGKADSNDSVILTDAWQNLIDNINKNLKQTKVIYSYDPHLIDAITLNKDNESNWSVNNFTTIKSNSIYKNTFELDPAKQAYNGFNMYESSRTRWNKPGTDSQTLELNKEYIEFPKTNEVKYVKDYTPKASFEGKNVCTDKTQLDMEKPNMPTVSFGIDIFKTRCFNWISCGLYDEYVFIKQDDETWKSFASYTTIASLDKMPKEKDVYPRRYEYTNKTIADGYTSLDINNSTYARFTFNLPANGTQITSHKCIVDIRNSSQDLETPKTYTYVVGRADKNGNPDFAHCSNELTFTIYPKSYTPRVYQITDQQGFHWVEYQVWGAAALKVLEKINNDQQKNNIIPILINTGDAVQAGCRINEWLDYYKGGECLFDHLEQMEIVGNNDLCGTDITFLGTGDDEGKSNSFFYSLFYCYQMDPAIPTLIKGLHNNEIKYIPSLYYFEYNNGKSGDANKTIRFVNINSEITYVNARDWFDLKISEAEDNKYVINPYNGYCLSDNTDYKTHVYCIDGGSYELSYGDTTRTASGINMVSIYEMLYRMINGDKTTTEDKTKYIVACHEMPFTVITHANMATTTQDKYRSASGKSLVGSHLNQLVSTETGAGTYWFSRLLEHKGIKLCIGGHKHTYCYTYPIREYYEYRNNNNEIQNSLDNGPMTMGNNLKNDSVSWVITRNDNPINTTKLPITKRTQESLAPITSNSSYSAETYFIPVTLAPNNDQHNFVVYFMCQATGYKLTSNKELPTPIQAFTQVLPQTSPGKNSDTPNANQKYPMFAVIGFDLTSNKISIKNIRVAEIYLRGAGKKGEAIYDPYNSTFNFTQQKYSTNDMYLEYLVDVNYYNSQCWKNETYGEHYAYIDTYNKQFAESKNIYSQTSKIPFDNYGVWTLEEMNIDNEISF